MSRIIARIKGLTPKMQTQITRSVTEAAIALQQNELVAIPTETVYGLAGNALSAEVVTEIFRVKNRPYFDPLIVHCSSPERAFELAEFTETEKQIAIAAWPGPLTLLVKKKKIIPDLVSSGSPFVGLRVPAHPLTLSLLELLNFPLAAPSANPFGYTSPTRPEHVIAQLGGKIPLVLDGGPCEIGLESTVVKIEGTQAVIYRPGGLEADFFKALGLEALRLQHASAGISPGTLLKHYSPRKSFYFKPIDFRMKDAHYLVFGAPLPDVDEHFQRFLSIRGDLSEAARNLFSLMREMDEDQEVSHIVAFPVPDQGLGTAINDRLQRAAARD